MAEPRYRPRQPQRGAYDVLVDDRAIGHVERVRVSTDRHVGRYRIPGKGRYVWRALLLLEDRQAESPDGRGELACDFDGFWRLEWRGQNFDTRRAATAALLEWHEHPEKRASAHGAAVDDLCASGGLG